MKVYKNASDAEVAVREYHHGELNEQLIEVVPWRAESNEPVPLEETGDVATANSSSATAMSLQKRGAQNSLQTGADTASAPEPGNRTEAPADYDEDLERVVDLTLPLVANLLTASLVGTTADDSGVTGASTQGTGVHDVSLSPEGSDVEEGAAEESRPEGHPLLISALDALHTYLDKLPAYLKEPADLESPTTPQELLDALAQGSGEQSAGADGMVVSDSGLSIGAVSGEAAHRFFHGSPCADAAAPADGSEGPHSTPVPANRANVEQRRTTGLTPEQAARTLELEKLLDGGLKGGQRLAYAEELRSLRELALPHNPLEPKLRGMPGAQGWTRDCKYQVPVPPVPGSGGPTIQGRTRYCCCQACCEGNAGPAGDGHGVRCQRLFLQSDTQYGGRASKSAC